MVICDKCSRQSRPRCEMCGRAVHRLRYDLKSRPICSKYVYCESCDHIQKADKMQNMGNPQHKRDLEKLKIAKNLEK